MLFAQHVNSPMQQYAIKFFLHDSSFRVERAAVCYPVRISLPSFLPYPPTIRCTHGFLAMQQRSGFVDSLYSSTFTPEDGNNVKRNVGCVQALRAAMPPVMRIESDPHTLSCATRGLPEPLNTWPLPPLIVTEKGESLDEFAARSAPDFFTSLQVRRYLLVLTENMVYKLDW